MGSENYLAAPRNHLIGWIVIAGKGDEGNVRHKVDLGLNSFVGDLVGSETEISVQGQHDRRNIADSNGEVLSKAQAGNLHTTCGGRGATNPQAQLGQITDQSEAGGNREPEIRTARVGHTWLTRFDRAGLAFGDVRRGDGADLG